MQLIQVWVWHVVDPSRNHTATRIASCDGRRSTAVIWGALSQFPACGPAASLSASMLQLASRSLYALWTCLVATLGWPSGVMVFHTNSARDTARSAVSDLVEWFPGVRTWLQLMPRNLKLPARTRFLLQGHTQCLTYNVCLGNLYCALFCVCPTRMRTVFTDSTLYENRMFSVGSRCVDTTSAVQREIDSRTHEAISCRWKLDLKSNNTIKAEVSKRFATRTATAWKVHFTNFANILFAAHTVNLLVNHLKIECI